MAITVDVKGDIDVGGDFNIREQVVHAAAAAATVQWPPEVLEDLDALTAMFDDADLLDVEAAQTVLDQLAEAAPELIDMLMNILTGPVAALGLTLIKQAGKLLLGR